MMEQTSLLVAFGAGLASFLSPCVVPLVPVYLGSIAGTEILEPGTKGNRLLVFLHSLSFVIGFSLLFVFLGVIAGLTGYAISPDPVLLNKISGSVLIFFGLFMLAAWKIPWLNYEKRFTPSLGATTSYLRSFIIGGVFALGWTACVGPILGSILALAMDTATAWRGAYLLSIYSLGLGLPFLIIGVALDSLAPLLKGIYRYANLLQIIGGLLLIVIGWLIITNNLLWFSSFAA